MRHYKIIDKIYHEVREKYPDLSEKEAAKVALEAYDDMDYFLMMGSPRPKGVPSITDQIVASYIKSKNNGKL